MKRLYDWQMRKERGKLYIYFCTYGEIEPLDGTQVHTQAIDSFEYHADGFVFVNKYNHYFCDIGDLDLTETVSEKIEVGDEMSTICRFINFLQSRKNEMMKTEYDFRVFQEQLKKNKLMDVLGSSELSNFHGYYLRLKEKLKEKALLYNLNSGELFIKICTDQRMNLRLLNGSLYKEDDTYHIPEAIYKGDQLHDLYYQLQGLMLNDQLIMKINGSLEMVIEYLSYDVTSLTIINAGFYPITIQLEQKTNKLYGGGTLQIKRVKASFSFECDRCEPKLDILSREDVDRLLEGKYEE